MNESHTTSNKPPLRGFKPVLVSETAFSSLKDLQSWKNAQSLNIRFDLKDLATAFVEVGIATPGFADKVVRKALDNARDQLNQQHAAIQLPTNDKESP